MTESAEKEFYKALGQLIKQARTNAKLKQEAFASMLNLSRASIVNIEKGRQRPPIHLLWDIGKALNISVTKLLPVVSTPDEINNDWKKIISDKSNGNTEVKQRLFRFVQEVQSSRKK